MKWNNEREREGTAGYYLELACETLGVLRRIIGGSGELTLHDYLGTLGPGAGPPCQDPADLFDVLRDLTTPLLGRSTARRAAGDLAEYPVVLTANHHGVDYFAQSIQGSLIFSLPRLTGEAPFRTIPVFSFGTIPLNNLTYPRGILLYGAGSGEPEDMPLKLPLFSDSQKRRMVSVTPPLDRKMIGRAAARFEGMVREGKVSPTLSDPLKRVLGEDYMAPGTLDLPTYSQQAVVLNSRIWKRLFPRISGAPDMVYLESEEIVARLLASDLSNPDSLAMAVMFDPPVRERVLEGLEDVKGCWDRAQLALRSGEVSSPGGMEKVAEGAGTVFFWAVDPTGRRIPLSLITDLPGPPVLRGMDDRGGLWECPFTPQAVTGNIAERKLLPSLFSCFLVLSLARGVVCLGGYFQAEYLPAMKTAVVRALEGAGGYGDMARRVAPIPADGYLSGMLAVMTRLDRDQLVPAGPLEMIAGGGLGSRDIEKMLSLTVREAHWAGLFETLQDVIPRGGRHPDWKRALAWDCFRSLKGRVVIK